MNQHNKIEYLFRHEYGKLVALLVRRMGLQKLNEIEDAVQWAMAQAVEQWNIKVSPDNPSAWLYQVAYRQMISEIRSSQRKKELLAESFAIQEQLEAESLDREPLNIALSGELSDSLLRMLFVACNRSIPVESQLVFTLKILCGFSIKEIAIRLFISEANAYKRFKRASTFLKRQPLKKPNTQLDDLSNEEMVKRLPSIHRILYLLFTEGHLSSHEDIAIRKDLCEEAIRLGVILVESFIGNVAESSALLALMYFHIARIDARLDGMETMLLQQQDRNQWDQQKIAQGLIHLQNSTQSEHISRYHIEAGIAAEHCLSKSFEQTPWERIIISYKLLEQVAPSPMHFLNGAIATAEYEGAEAALSILNSADIPKWFDHTYHWYAVLADLYFRSNQNALGKTYATKAIDAAPTKNIKQILIKRLLSGQTYDEIKDC